MTKKPQRWNEYMRAALVALLLIITTQSGAESGNLCEWDWVENSSLGVQKLEERPNFNLSRNDKYWPTRIHFAASGGAPKNIMVQLGAFKIRKNALSTYLKIKSQNREKFKGKQLVIRSPLVGGRMYYQLRLMGFIDTAEAKNFCSSLDKMPNCLVVVVQ